jgi:hypothetical protein
MPRRGSHGYPSCPVFGGTSFNTTNGDSSDDSSDDEPRFRGSKHSTDVLLTTAATAPMAPTRYASDTRMSRESRPTPTSIMKQMDDVKSAVTVAVFSKRNIGKSVLAKHLMMVWLKLKKVDMVVVFSGSITNGDWDCVLPKNRVEGLNTGKLRQLLDFQHSEAEKHYKDKSYKPNRLAIFFDDVIGGEDESKEAKHLLNRLYSRGRHEFTDVCITAQYPKGIVTPTMRNNIDFCAISKNNKEVTDMMFSVVNSFNGSRKDFADFIEGNTHDHQFVWFNNSRNSASKGVWSTVKVPAAAVEAQKSFRLRPASCSGKRKRASE